MFPKDKVRVVAGCRLYRHLLFVRKRYQPTRRELHTFVDTAAAPAPVMIIVFPLSMLSSMGTKPHLKPQPCVRHRGGGHLVGSVHLLKAVYIVNRVDTRFDRLELYNHSGTADPHNTSRMTHSF